jgi:hypothetical protein
MPVHRTEVVIIDALSDSNANLVTVIKRVPPVQSCPNARVACFVSHRHQVVIGSLGLNQLRPGILF